MEARKLAPIGRPPINGVREAAQARQLTLRPLIRKIVVQPSEGPGAIKVKVQAGKKGGHQ